MSRTLHRLAPAALAAAALLALAACGSTTAGADPGPSSQSYAGGTDTRQPPGAFGTIAAISGKTLQVQNKMTGQVAVSYTGTTAISAEVKTTLAGVNVGSCVVVTSDSSSAGADAGPITASAVRISPRTGGSCGFAGPGGGRGGPSGTPSFAPSGRPTDVPSDGARRVGFGAAGEVTAVRKDGFTLAANLPSTDGSSPSPTAVSVSVTGATTYTTTRKASPAALKTGKCVQAVGRTDDTGAVTATSLTVSDPVDGTCAGFMMRGPR